jgi:flagellar basal-body rod modification protein FlgD
MTTIQPTLANIPATTPAVGAAAASKASAGSSADTQNRFLTMLVAQLKNQDPLNPMDNAAITSQMAQLSTVNGVEQLNATMKGMASGFDSLQAVQAASLAGRQVMTDGNMLALSNGSASAGFQLDQPVDKLAVIITDAAGVQVQSVDLGAQPDGIHAFQWDGMTDAAVAAAPGNYTFALHAFAQDQSVTAQSLVIGRVDGVSRTSNGVVLSVGGVGNVGLADVKRILQ